MGKGFVELVPVWFPAPKACIECPFYRRTQCPIADECMRFGCKRIIPEIGPGRDTSRIRTERPDWCIALDDTSHWASSGHTTPQVTNYFIDKKPS
jgi:hypothetical protein